MIKHDNHAIRISCNALLAICLFAASSVVRAGDPAISMTVANEGASFWLIDGVRNPELILTRGRTYEFMLQAVPEIHPFNINTENTTGDGSQYNDGVTNNHATGSMTLTFTVPQSAPDSLHYNCFTHAAMNGPITIINADPIFANGFDGS